MKILERLKRRLKDTSKFKYFGEFSQTEVFEVIDKLIMETENQEPTQEELIKEDLKEELYN